jgi:hypothetical protein
MIFSLLLTDSLGADEGNSNPSTLLGVGANL